MHSNQARHHGRTAAIVAGLGVAVLLGAGSTRTAFIGQQALRGLPPVSGLPMRRRPAMDSRSEAERVVHAYMTGRSAGAFNRASYVDHLVVAEPGVVLALQSFAEQRRRPPQGAERAAAIELLEEVARGNLGQDPVTRCETGVAEAEEALVNLVRDDDGAELTNTQAALAALTRVDSRRALRVLVEVPQERRTAALRTAVLAGLTDAGVPQAQAMERLRRAWSPASSP